MCVRGGLCFISSAPFTGTMGFRPLDGLRWVASLVARACEAVAERLHPKTVAATPGLADRQAAVTRRRTAAHEEEEAASERYMHRYTRSCPRCKARAVKEEGCDHVVCWCGHAFNWSTAHYWQQ